MLTGFISCYSCFISCYLLLCVALQACCHNTWKDSLLRNTRATPLQSLLLTRNMSAPSQQLRPVPGTAAQPWMIYIHAAFPRSPKIAIFWCDFSTILCEFTRLTHILFGLILCKGKKLREPLVPGSGEGGLMAGCTGLWSQSELSCRLSKNILFGNHRYWLLMV